MQKPEIIFNDQTDSVSAEKRERIELGLSQAYEEWLSLIPGSHALQIQVNVVADARPQFALVRSTQAKIVARNKDGGDVLMPSAGYKAITGTDDHPSDPDIVIDLYERHFDKLAWNDEQLTGSDLMDPKFIFRHALAQGLFMRRASTDPKNSDKTTWDLNIEKIEGKFYFKGTHAENAAGAAVSLPVSHSFLLPIGNEAADQSGLHQFSREILSDCGFPTDLSDGITFGRRHRGEVDMGEGFDTATREGQYKEFLISRDTANFAWDEEAKVLRWEGEVSPWRVVHKITGYELTFANAERLRFEDKVVALDIDGNAGLVYSVLKTALGREPDETELARWVKVVDALGDEASNGGLDKRLLQVLWDDGVVQRNYGLDELPSDFMANPAVREQLTTRFIAAVYWEALNRKVVEKDGITDLEGRDFWLNWINGKIEPVIETGPDEGRVLEVYRDFLREILQCDELTVRTEKETVGLTGINLDLAAYLNPDL
ncbi:hypothetical protein ACFQU1_03055 [Chelatococcus sp. GCM10030263]|uniref:hypothetical protein n=1 Tax=Chelatococcus sp. GCM10030263 TaxID=3273387 RepID=UPI00361772D6